MRLAPLVAALALLLPATASAAERTYIVMLGDGPGIAKRQRAALEEVRGTPDVIYSYRDAFPGFAARLTARQRAELARAPQVAKVFRSRKRTLQSVATDETALDAASGFGDSPAYLGLPAGLWNTLGGSEKAGEDVVVGVLDSGITPQHPSFSGAGFPPPPADFTTSCETAGDPSPTGFCNDKLIGARSFVEGFGAQHVAPGSFLSPRDDDGHGTHTASTAAGNFGVNPSILGNDLGVDRISGIAPRARVAVYKVCWVGGDVDNGCTDADSVAAIDAAVADGVDVINYSVGGEDSNVVDPVEYAFLGAAEAGVFVAVSAGNDGPGPETVGTPATVPWLTAVAANAPARTFTATATITPAGGPAFSVTGASVMPALGETAIVDGGVCLPGSLGAVSGRVVLCRRGENDRVEKSRVVRDAGGTGMILANVADAEDTVTDTHFVPTVHVSKADGDRIRAALPATAAFTRGTASRNESRTVAAFSSRGPQTAVPDLAKPDLSAPGVNILGANSPDPAGSLRGGELYQAISGTSMSSPHVAGAAALLRQQHPAWSPSAIKSALMLTAKPLANATPLDQGSGEIDPTAAGAAGLVMNETTDHFLGYLDGTVAPSDLNLPSVAGGSVAGTFATKRTFTSTAATARRWTVKLAVPGFDASAGIGNGGFATVNVEPGASVVVDVAATRTTAPLGAYAFGQLTLTSPGQTLRVPVSLRPVALKVDDPITATADTSDGTFEIPVQAGFAGTLSAEADGFAAPDLRAEQSIGPSPSGTPSATAGPGTSVFDVVVPDGAKLLSARISNATAGSDLDLFLYRDGTLVDSSASSGADETINLLAPALGTYRLSVVGFTTADPTSTYDLATYVVGPGDQGFDITGDPFDVGIGDAVTLTGEYAGVDAAGLYLGVASFSTGDRRVVELTKTEDTFPAEPEPEPEPEPVAKRRRPTLRVLGAKLIRHRVLRLRVKVNRRARVDLRVSRRGRTKANAKARVVKKGTRVVRYRLTRRLRPKRTYRVAFALKANGLKGRAAVRIRVRR